MLLAYYDSTYIAHLSWICNSNEQWWQFKVGNSQTASFDGNAIVLVREVDVVAFPNETMDEEDEETRGIIIAVTSDHDI